MVQRASPFPPVPGGPVVCPERYAQALKDDACRRPVTAAAVRFMDGAAFEGHIRLTRLDGPFAEIPDVRYTLHHEQAALPKAAVAREAAEQAR